MFQKKSLKISTYHIQWTTFETRVISHTLQELDVVWSIFNLWFSPIESEILTKVQLTSKLSCQKINKVFERRFYPVGKYRERLIRLSILTLPSILKIVICYENRKYWIWRQFPCKLKSIIFLHQAQIQCKFRWMFWIQRVNSMKKDSLNCVSLLPIFFIQQRVFHLLVLVASFWPAP